MLETFAVAAALVVAIVFLSSCFHKAGRVEPSNAKHLYVTSSQESSNYTAIFGSA